MEKTKQVVQEKRKKKRREDNSMIKLYFTKKNAVMTKATKSCPVIV